MKEGQRSIVEYEGRDLTHTRDEPRVRHGSSSGKVEEPWLEETETKGGEKEREREGGREKERERGREREPVKVDLVGEPMKLIDLRTLGRSTR